MKTCSRCKIEKSAAEYHFNRHPGGKRYSICRKCVSVIKKTKSDDIKERLSRTCQYESCISSILGLITAK